MSKNLFNSVQMSKPKRSLFDLSHDVKLTMNIGKLVPVMQMECVPGDKVKLGCESLIRFAPMLAPVMHRLNMSVHYFFVPYRILWDGWENFITRDETAGIPAFPTVNIGADEFNLRLADYLGIPSPAAADHTVSALPFAAYQKIYSEFYRDQNLVLEPVTALTDGNNSSNGELFPLRTRAWQHDYFTASLPFAQKGAAVTLPLGSVTMLDAQVYKNTGSGNNSILTATPANINQPGRLSSNPAVPVDHLYAKTGASAQIGSVSINDLRRSFRLQEWLERNARGGTRYVENILAHFGVRSSDKRLQRPEYITGVKAPVVISEVLSTFQEAATPPPGPIPQGNMSGHGIAVASGNHGSYFCEEHGIIMGILTVMPLPTYQQGIDKMYLKRDPLDYYWPAFSNLGEQAVVNKEIYADSTTPDGVFGYVPRYSEYKFMPNRVAGQFRDSLDFWHFGRQFTNAPVLNQEFIECNPDNRQFAITGTDVDHLYVHCLNKITAIRPMPKFGTPTI